MNRQRVRSTQVGVAAAACTALALTLAGCGSSSGHTSSASTGLHLTVEDYYTQPAAAEYDSIYNACAKQLGDTVTISHIAGAALIPKVLQQASSRTMPDVLMLDNPDVAQIAATGALSPLSDYGITGAGYVPGIIAAGSYQGKLYGLAPAVNSLALFYNTDMFKAAGLTPPTTWAELQSDAKALTKSGRYGFAFSGVNTYEGTWQFMPWMWTSGGDEKNIDTPQTAAALQLLTSLVKDGSASKSVDLWTQNDVESQFAAGKAAMMENGPWNIAQLQQVKGLHWASVPLPTPTAGQKVVSPLGGETYTVPQTGDSAKMAAAGKIVACINSDANQVTIAKTVAYVPAKTSVAEQFAKDNPLMAPYVTVAQTARSRTGELGTGWDKAATAIYTAEQQALTGEASPAAALKQAQGQ
ncbi:extracellular solute-binding protein [Streptacidiphilus sp. PB12-B1b]|uniref:sugar ABC transporter substrate-binding protein n=1 Tax=Streptacidiphilus TaxID=228398 RepID=UPI0005A86BF7|nr:MULTISPECIES: extracellular solute-binding protein [Streptacidiphilus]QMU78421.1 extracellular solute-binding protein [Streptacidiphilus sp. PB12-B1b]